jgi:threonine/homoserine/homoserine lactone efflux protein
MIYMAVQTLAHGARAGWLSSAAFHLASYLHILLAAFGVAVLIKAAPALVLGIKLVGAGYLIWMGIRLVIRRPAPRAIPGSPPVPDASQAFRDSLIVEGLNPKSALFYLAFLPQFATPDGAFPIWLQLIVLGTMANLLFSLTDVFCILAARAVKVWAAPRAQLTRLGRWLGGLVLIAMGLRLGGESI